MAKTITLSDPYVLSLKIDIVDKKIILEWAVDDDAGRIYKRGQFIFWHKLPATSGKVINYDIDGSKIIGDAPIPDTWKELSTSGKTSITTLVKEATTFLSEQSLP